MRSKHRIHNRQSFYKYMSLDTAKIVLSSQTLRWSSPLIFNDPFDVPRELLPDLNEKHVLQALARKLVSEITTPRKNFDDINIRLRPLFEHIQSAFPNGLSTVQIPEFEERMVNPPVGNGAKDSLNDLKRLWQIQLIGRRILCLSENPLIMPMWNHYADRYRGIVLEFACSDELSSAWLQAKPIKYTYEKPLTYSAPGMAELLFQEDGNAISYINNEIPYLKTPEWEYEREWRVSAYKRDGDEELFSDFGFHSKELQSVILGPHFDMGQLDTVVDILRPYPHYTLFHAVLNAHREIVLNTHNR